MHSGYRNACPKVTIPETIITFMKWSDFMSDHTNFWSDISLGWSDTKEKKHRHAKHALARGVWGHAPPRKILKNRYYIAEYYTTFNSIFKYFVKYCIAMTLYTCKAFVKYCMYYNEIVHLYVNFTITKI